MKICKFFNFDFSSEKWSKAAIYFMVSLWYFNLLFRFLEATVIIGPNFPNPTNERTVGGDGHFWLEILTYFVGSRPAPSDYFDLFLE